MVLVGDWRMVCWSQQKTLYSTNTPTRYAPNRFAVSGAEPICRAYLAKAITAYTLFHRLNHYFTQGLNSQGRLHSSSVGQHI